MRRSTSWFSASARLGRLGRAVVVGGALACIPLAAGAQAPKAQGNTALAEKVQTIVSRPEFQHATWGVEF